MVDEAVLPADLERLAVKAAIFVETITKRFQKRPSEIRIFAMRFQHPRKIGIKNPVQQCNRHAAIVKSIIPDIPVISIICIANDGVIIKGRSNCKIPIVKADLLQDFIEEYQTPVNLSKEEIEATLHTIDSYKVSEQLVLEEPKFIAPPQ